MWCGKSSWCTWSDEWKLTVKQLQLIQPQPKIRFEYFSNILLLALSVLRHPLFGRHVRLSSGSGFIVTHSGVIVTNAHVVTTAATVTGRPQLRVQLHDGDAYEATVREVDRKADIATIKVNPQVRADTHWTQVHIHPVRIMITFFTLFSLSKLKGC